MIRVHGISGWFAVKQITALRHTFRALRFRNFRLFFMGQSISLVGTWMQQIAMSWLVYRLTGSAFMLGLIGFVSQAPSFVLTPFTGIMADRLDRRRILIIAQVLFMLQAFALAALTLTGAVAVWHVILLSFLFGCIGAVEIPARQSFVVEMVEGREHLGNAIALNSFMFNAARLVGPSIAGVLIAAAGEGVCFLANGISFIAVIGSLRAMKTASHPLRRHHGPLWEGMREGWQHTFGFAPIRTILSLLGTISAVGMSYAVLMPVFAKEILGGGASTLGFLMASAGVGALVGTVYLASRRSIVGLVRMMPRFAALFAAGLIMLAFSHLAALSYLLLAVIGFGFMVAMASSNTVVQTIVDDDKRGRVMSFYTMMFMGMAPLGSIAGGALAGRFGVTITLVAGGIVSLAAAYLFWRQLPRLRELIHPIYRRNGIITETALRP